MTKPVRADQAKSLDVFAISADVISRKNQDGTVILMRMDESSLFFKMDGVAALIWAELNQPRNRNGIISALSAVYPSFRKKVESDVTALIEQLTSAKLVTEITNGKALAPEFSKSLSPDAYHFGELKEFSLEEIETEVLKESVYLDVFAGSDLRLKKNVTPIRGALEKIQQIEGVTYEWDESRVPSHFGPVKTDKTVHAGLIAQEVAAVMPEIVRADAKTGMMAIEYSKLASYFVEAIKDLNTLVTRQQERIKNLEEKLGKKDPQ